VDFYRATVAPKELVYLRRADFPSGGTAWFVLQSKEADGARAIEVDGVGYELAGVFPYYGPGGWTWSVYRRRG
jgi:hypothetical protein